MAAREIVLGTRGSDLARTQARMAEKVLRAKCDVAVRIEIVKTRGDENKILSPATRDEGRKGMFTAELERALLETRIDIAVHSAKDLPSEMDERLKIAAVLPRGSVHDLLVTKRVANLTALPNAAKIATGSIRRQRQLCWVRPDFVICDLRGNVPTRLQKFLANDWDAMVLAQAGLERLNFRAPKFAFEKQEFFAEVLPLEIFVPAGGQGVIALQTRMDDVEICRAANDLWTEQCLSAEREFLRLLQGDCNLPVGAHARVIGDEIELRAQVFGKTSAPKMARARKTDPLQVAREVFLKIR